MLSISQVHKSYNNLQVLKGIDLTVQQGEVVTIVGASGAGKSTLLHIAGTLDKPDNGIVEINNVNPFQLKSHQLAAFRNKHIGFIFQFHNLLPEFSALENVLIPAYIGGENNNQVMARGMHLLEKLGVADRASHKPSELSGGEAQRVAVARALINSPKIIFADEPSGNLDSDNADMLHQLLMKLRNDLGQTFIIVTHNTSFASQSDRMLTIKDGKIEYE